MTTRAPLKEAEVSTEQLKNNQTGVVWGADFYILAYFLSSFSMIAALFFAISNYNYLKFLFLL